MCSQLVVVASILLCVLAQNPRPNTNVLLIQDMIYTSGAPINSSSPSGGDGQQVALASYIDPLGDPASWARMIGYPTNKLSVLVANVVNGPDSVTDPNWLNVIQQSAASGKKVLGYVRTGYLGVSEQQYKTRLNSIELADWVAQIEEDVDMWYNLYPGMMGGIFFDEGWNECGDNNEYSDLYEYITQSTKRKHPGAFTVLNPGTGVPQCFENSADTLLTSETSYETYTTAFVSNGWTPQDPRKIWHIIYDVPDGQGPAVAALALQRGAGLIEITNGVQPNPYDTLPADEYMQGVFNAITGGTPLDGGLNAGPGGVAASDAPSVFTVNSFEYSSVTLGWSSAPNAIGYRIYTINVDNQGQVFPSLDLPASMTGVTVGGLVPGTRAYQFQVGTIGGDGRESPVVHSVESGTEALPGSGYRVNNIKASPLAGSTTFQADVLVPYAFIRVFIWNGDDSCAQAPGWPINYTPGDYICAQYMVESGTLYSYNGAPGAFTWSWAIIGSVTPIQVGYTVTWNVPVGLSSANTSHFVIQAQGYNPLTNVFSPCGALTGAVTSSGAHCEN